MNNNKENEHDCREFVNTIWVWDWRIDDYKPFEDVCTKCGKVIYEY